MRNLLAGVQGGAELARGDIERIAGRILGRFNLSPGCDARDLAHGIDLDVCPHKGPTRVRGPVLYYNETLLPRDRNWRICRAIAEHVLTGGGLGTTASINILALALCTRSSGVWRRLA